MLAKKVKYTDYEGVEREETHYFNLTKAEVMEWLATDGDYTLDKVLLQLMKNPSGRKIMDVFKDLLHRSYGRKSLDGRRFEKSEEIWLDFAETEAYSEIFMELVTDADKATAFLNAIVPEKLAEEARASLKENRDKLPEEIKDYVPKE
jgi:hypothetical protein